MPAQLKTQTAKRLIAELDRITNDLDFFAANVAQDGTPWSAKVLEELEPAAVALRKTAWALREPEGRV
jgi:hypothetical protein